MRSTVASLRLPVSGALATVLASLCLGGTFLTGAWFLPALFAVVVTVGVGEGARRLAVPRPLVPVAGFLGLLLYLVVLYARQHSLFGVLPTHETLDRFQALVRSGRQDIARYAAPVGVSSGIGFLVTSGVGVVALLVDALAVTWRRAAVAGLPLLALYTVPTTVAPDGVGWVAFTLGGIGFLTLLLAEARERVNRWGRPMNYIAPRPNWSPDVETAPLAQVGRRVGAAALGLALAVPAVMPEVDASSFGFAGSGFGRGHGGGNQVKVINPILDLGKDLRRGANSEVIRYTGPATYLRLVGLDVFSGDKWGPSKYTVSNQKNNVERGLIAPPGLGRETAATKQQYSIKVFDLDETWLPLPYPTRKVANIDGGWVYDASTFNVFPLNRSTRQISYDVESLAVNPTVAQLRAAPAPPDSLNRYLQLPAGMPPVVAQTAQAQTRGLATAFDKAVALQNWLKGPDFVYDTEVADTLGDANGVQAIAAFLQSRQGYCVHFASTMAVMARMLGIPARVAVGFTPGTLDPDGSGAHVVSLHDAHAWPELYFAGVGWTRFEPTPAGGRVRVPGFTQGAGVGNNDTIRDPQATGDNQAQPQPSQQATRIPQGVQPALTPPPRPRATGAGTAGLRLPVLPMATVLALVLLGLVPRTARALVRRGRWRRATSPALLATATWEELRDTLLDYGYEWQPNDPPRRGTARLLDERRLRGDARAALLRIASAIERARYASELGAVGDLRADVETVRRGLADGASARTRLRARFLPRSAAAVSAALSERLADVLDGLDALGSRLRPRRGAG
jgi:transglutaminase-like putative cysteine protease